MKSEQTIITVIDDNLEMTNLLTTLLEIEKFKVVPVRNTSLNSVTNTLIHNKPHVIIMDIHLNDSNGIEILKYIKKNPQLAGIRAILTSGENLEKESMDAGADYFLLKPYMPHKLLRLLSEITNEKEGV